MMSKLIGCVYSWIKGRLGIISPSKHGLTIVQDWAEAEIESMDSIGNDDTVISKANPLTPKDKAIMAAIGAAILEFRTSGEAMKVVDDD